MAVTRLGASGYRVRLRARGVSLSFNVPVLSAARELDDALAALKRAKRDDALRLCQDPDLAADIVARLRKTSADRLDLTGLHEVAKQPVRTVAVMWLTHLGTGLSKRQEAYSAGTIENYRREITRFGEWAKDLPVDQVTNRVVYNFREVRAKESSASTANRSVVAIRAFLAYCRDDIAGLGLDLRPLTLKDLKEPKQLESPPDDEALDQIIASLTGTQWHRFLLVLRQSGMRLGEARGLRWGDIDGSTVIVRPHAERGLKTSSSHRRLPLPPALADATPEGKTAYIFPHIATTDTGVATAWRRACERLGVKARIHDLRHAYCYGLIRDGVNLGEVRDLMGHASLVTTNRYVQRTRI